MPLYRRRLDTSVFFSCPKRCSSLLQNGEFLPRLFPHLRIGSLLVILEGMSTSRLTLSKVEPCGKSRRRRQTRNGRRAVQLRVRFSRRSYSLFSSLYILVFFSEISSPIRQTTLLRALTLERISEFNDVNGFWKNDRYCWIEE